MDLGEPDAREMDAYTVSNFRDIGEVTWSEDDASGWGVPYVRADLAALTSAPAVPEALKWCAAALQAVIDSRGERGSISMVVSGEKKTLDEVLDMADMALEGVQPGERGEGG